MSVLNSPIADRQVFSLSASSMPTPALHWKHVPITSCELFGSRTYRVALPGDVGWGKLKGPRFESPTIGPPSGVVNPVTTHDRTADALFTTHVRLKVVRRGSPSQIPGRGVTVKSTAM